MKEAQAFHRFYNSSSGTHFCTGSQTEKDGLIQTAGAYSYEGVAYYLYAGLPA